MTGPAETAPATPAVPGVDGGAVDAEAEAARERQSHVRHELRAPLAVIYPLLSLLMDESDGESTPQQREYLAVLERNVERLEALLVGVADSGWAECSAAPAVPVAIAPVDLAEGVVALRRAGHRGGPAVVVLPGASPSPQAWADRDDVRQIITGLVGNATTYAPTTDRVTVRVVPGDTPAKVVVEVEDDGPGMPPEELARAFEFGFRGRLAAQLKAPGLGIGLWVCRELAGRNGGTVQLAAKPGVGLRATLTLPAAPIPAAVSAEAGAM
jgi:signal transduction histidine kinase